MEKIIYLLWNKHGQTIPAWRELLQTEVAKSLLEEGAQNLQFDIADERVESGKDLRIITTKAPPDGLVMFWLDTAKLRDPLEAILREQHARIAGYLVTESCIKAGSGYRKKGAHTPGFSLIGFLQQPRRLSEEQWLNLWLDQHTKVAVETQSTIRYVQNVVSRVLTNEAPVLHAVVEEGFPIEALTSPHAFYNAVDDDNLYRRNLDAMMDSCFRFIDFDKIDSIPMSEYIIS